MIKIIIAGSRDFEDYELLKRFCDSIIEKLALTDVQIVSGGCSGADYLGEQYALERGHKLVNILPNWELHGKAAGPIRNREMAQYADILIAFWDGKSRGTKSMIDEASKASLVIYTCNTISPPVF